MPDSGITRVSAPWVSVEAPISATETTHDDDTVAKLLPGVGETLDGGHAPLGAGVRRDPRRFVDGIQHVGRFIPRGREALSCRIAITSFGEFLPRSRRQRRVLLPIRRIRREPRVTLFEIDAAETFAE